MKKRLNILVSNLLVLALLISSFAVGPVNQISWADEVQGGLIFSEYIEGSGVNKAIEIYNTSDKYLKLEDYYLEYFKDGTKRSEIKLSSSTGANVISPGAILVMYNSRKSGDTPAYINSSMLKKENVLYKSESKIAHNGNDTYRLVEKASESVIDVIGPKKKTDFAKDVTFIRRPHILKGNTSNNFMPYEEWARRDKNDVSDLGSHTIDKRLANQLERATVDKFSGTFVTGTQVGLNSTSNSAIKFVVKPLTYSGTPNKSEFLDYTNKIRLAEDSSIFAYTTKSGALDSVIAKYSYDLMNTSPIADAKKQLNKIVAIQGVVTAKSFGDYYLQDDTAGIMISSFKMKGFKAAVGERVNVIGVVSEYKGQSQITPINRVAVDAIADDIKLTPQKVTSKQVNEEVESELVLIENVEVVSVDSYRNYEVKDSEGRTTVYLSNGIGNLSVGEHYKRIEGCVNQRDKTYKIVVSSLNDIEVAGNKTKEVSANLGKVGRITSVKPGSYIKLSNVDSNAKIYYTVGANTEIAEPVVGKSPLYSGEKITLDENNKVVKAIALTDGKDPSKVSTFEYRISDFVTIGEIQGRAHVSPYNYEEVKDVRGIVTARSSDYFQKGFYIQSTDVTSDFSTDEKNETSDGIFVKTSDYKSVEIGDLVDVSGTVKEVVNGVYNPDNTETMIEMDSVKVLSSKNELPQATALGEGCRKLITDVIEDDKNATYNPTASALDLYESLEGMRVKVNKAHIVGVAEKYGEFSVLADGGKASMNKLTPEGGIKATLKDHNPEIIHIDDTLIPITKKKKYIDPSYAPKVGDKFDGSIVGVMSFGFGKYKVLNTEKLPALIDGGLQIHDTKIVPHQNKMTIASFNIENFHQGVGADKISRIAKTISKQLKTPDVVALIEMQDNNGAKNGEKKDGVTSADENAKVLIDAINAKRNTPVNYKYIDIEPVELTEGGEPGGNIRVGYLYNTDRVSLYNAPKGSSTEDVVYKNGHLMNNPGRVATNNKAFESTRRALATEFVFKGQSVVVIANHLSSKRGDEGEFGPNQPPNKPSEVNRGKQASAINAFIDRVLADNQNANVVVLGDLNDYEYSNTLELLKGSGQENVLTNMIDKLPVKHRYTYVHNGNSQVLDHILVSNNLVSRTKLDIVHANSIVTEASGRSSDHDPLMIQLNFHVDSSSNNNNDRPSKSSNPDTKTEPQKSKDQIKKENVEKTKASRQVLKDFKADQKNAVEATKTVIEAAKQIASGLKDSGMTKKEMAKLASDLEKTMESLVEKPDLTGQEASEIATAMIKGTLGSALQVDGSPENAAELNKRAEKIAKNAIKQNGKLKLNSGQNIITKAQLKDTLQASIESFTKLRKDLVEGGLTKAASKLKPVINVSLPQEDNKETQRIAFDKESLDTLAASQAEVEIEMGDLSFSMPADMLAEFQENNLVIENGTLTRDQVQNLGATLTEAGVEANIVSDVFEIDFQSSGKDIEIGSEKPQLTIDVSNMVSLLKTQAHLLSVFVYDEEAQVWEHVPSKIVGGLAVFEAPHFSKYAVLKANVKFDDINGHWAQETIEMMSANEITAGRTDSSFKPDENITRAEFAAYLVNMLGLEGEVAGNFKDVDADAWYYQEVGLAAINGLVSGVGEGNFAPNATITRQDMALMMSKAYKLQNDEKMQGTADMFVDNIIISEYAKEAVYAARYHDIVGGFSDGSFRPKQSATRAQAAQMLRSFWEQN